METYLPLVDGLTAPKTGDPQVDGILEVLHLDRVREKAAAAAAVAVAADDGVGAPAIDGDENMADRAAEVKQALRILVRTATEEFGFIPRDVYNGIVDLPDMRLRHTEALCDLDYSQLKVLVNKFTGKKALDVTSSCVVAVFPTQNFPNYDLCEVDFKSIRIAEDAAEVMQQRGGQHLREIYDSIRALPDGSRLAGRIFEEIVHDVLCEGSTLSYGPMASNKAEPPTFHAAGSPSMSLSPISGRRVDTRVDFESELSTVTLDSGRYYIPTASNHPLFDSFTIDTDSCPVVISVFQMTISSRHEGSAKGYFHIRQLKTHVRKLLKDEGRIPPPSIKVQYFLVCPDDRTERRWEMPAGWGEGKNNTHRGDVFCIRVPSPHL